MGKVLIASYDMEVGGVERSLAGLLNEFDYDRYQVDVMLYRHRGDFMGLLNRRANLLAESPAYATFRSSIMATVRSGKLGLGMARVLAKAVASVTGSRQGLTEPGYLQMQLTWKYALPFLPNQLGEYDAAISYLWPHYYVADKVSAKRKLAWIHTDYSTVETNVEQDLVMWRKFDAIVAVSEACKESFLSKYGELRSRVRVIENIVSLESVRTLAGEIEGTDAEAMLADSRFKLLTVARLSHAKGIDQAVQALKLLADRGMRDIVWYVVGYGGDEDSIRELIRQNGLQNSFVLLGKQLNPYPFMAACDLYVQPSRYEGKAVTVTEAQMLGKPVMITRYSTAASQVNDGYDGYIAELSAEGIADGIEHLYRNDGLRAELSEYCRTQNYSCGEQLEQLYELIGDRTEWRGSA
ncbi:glycosyl transferase [Paenibacillus sp. MY03]|nr:glycosyltransferase [Paenibacillus sp. MY03]OUS78292.1 glycosyl transferase [Paenibacillus sp. MY03]